MLQVKAFEISVSPSCQPHNSQHNLHLAPNPLTTAPIISDKGPSHLTVEWTGISDSQNRVQGYVMEYRRLEDPSWAEFGGVIRHDNLKRTYMERITGLNPDTSYVVRIKVLYKDNKISDPSPQAEARTGCQGTIE